MEDLLRHYKNVHNIVTEIVEEGEGFAQFRPRAQALLAKVAELGGARAYLRAPLFPLFSLQPAAHHPPPVRRAGRLAAHAGEAAAAAPARWGHCRWRGVDDRVGAAGGGKAWLIFLYASYTPAALCDRCHSPVEESRARGCRSANSRKIRVILIEYLIKPRRSGRG